MNLSIEKKLMELENKTCGCQVGGRGSGVDWEFGVNKMQTIAFGMDEQWDPAVLHWELYLVTYDGAW